MNHFDTESEEREEANMKAEKLYRTYMSNLNEGDMHDLLDWLGEDEQFLTTLLHIMVLTKDAQALLHLMEKRLKQKMMDLANEQVESP